MTTLTSELFEILRGFASLTRPNSLNFPARLPLSIIHDFFLKFILTNPHFQSFPPSIEYQKAFWKWAISHLEAQNNDEDFEIDPRIYDHYISLMPPSGLALGPAKVDLRGQTCPQGLPLRAPPGPSHVTHFWKTPSEKSKNIVPLGTIDLAEYETVTLMESRTIIESGTTGLRTWLASFVLSQYLIDHPDLVRNKRVLELGSGVGFLGTIVARLQQGGTSNLPDAILCMSDNNEDVLKRCRENVQLPCNRSSLSGDIMYQIIDWSSALDSELSPSLTQLLQDVIKADLVLGADLVFDPSLIPALIATIKLCLQPRQLAPKLALIGITVRNLTTLTTFLNLAQEEHLIVEEVPTQNQTSFLETIETNTQENVKLFKFSL